MRKIQLGKRRTTLVLLLLFIFIVRLVPHLGEWYAVSVYPCLSAALSWLSAAVPFSLDEWIVVFAFIFMVIYPFYAHRKGRKWKHAVAADAEMVGWIVVWFYLGWGMNYFRDSFYERAGIKPIKVDKQEFKDFLIEYTDSLNATYIGINTVDEESIRREIKGIYCNVAAHYSLCKPHDYQQPKTVVFNWLYSFVGVLGYMGPFADESHLNQQLFPVQYPFTYAHELAHLLSISSEAEANYWAYQTCTHSTDRFIRYSGYYGLLPNVYRNAMGILSKQEFEAWHNSIDKRIIAERLRQQDFWRKQYNPLLADAQDLMFNMLLKGNKIPDGTVNYDRVVAMILACPDISKTKHEKRHLHQ